MPDQLDQQLRQLKDEALLRRDEDDELDRKIAELAEKINAKYAHTKKDKWHRMKESE